MTIGYEGLPRPIRSGLVLVDRRLGDTAAGHHHAIQPGHAEPVGCRLCCPQGVVTRVLTVPKMAGSIAARCEL